MNDARYLCGSWAARSVRSAVAVSVCEAGMRNVIALVVQDVDAVWNAGVLGARDHPE